MVFFLRIPLENSIFFFCFIEQIAKVINFHVYLEMQTGQDWLLRVGQIPNLCIHKYPSSVWTSSCVVSIEKAICVCWYLNADA